jgi:GTP-binding protein
MGFGGKETMSTRDYEEKIKASITVYRCAILFCIGFDQTAFVKSIRSYSKVYENRQQRIATSKFNEFMLKLSKRIRHQQQEICKIKYCMQLPTNTTVCIFLCHNMLRNLQTLSRE